MRRWSLESTAVEAAHKYTELRWRPARCGGLCAGDALVLEDANDDAAVLGLSFGGGVGVDLRRGTHCAGSEHVGERDSALLLEDCGDGVGALAAELLIQCGAANCRGVSLNLNDVGGDAFGLLSELN